MCCNVDRKQRLQEKKKKYRERKKEEAKQEENALKQLEEYTHVVRQKMALQVRMVMNEGGNTQEYLQWLEANTFDEHRELMPEDQASFVMGVLRNAGAFDLNSYLTPPPPQ